MGLPAQPLSPAVLLSQAKHWLLLQQHPDLGFGVGLGNFTVGSSTIWKSVAWPGLPQGVREGGGTTAYGSSPESLLSDRRIKMCFSLSAALLSIFSQELSKEIKTLTPGLKLHVCTVLLPVAVTAWAAGKHRNLGMAET